ncbi:energy-coupling factor transporter ATP-binding protein EcfA2 [Skermanella aerolata]|uniref:ATP-binding protein n=1 Tax=Skermanella aerolata TaxID=393310 RepID=UPI003D20E7A4
MSREEIREAKTIASGDGERRAQRGYVFQYDLGARVIYEALAAGRLKWIGVADRGAGTFDDIVLGLHDRIAAYQIKTSRDPEPFSIRTILLGAKNLLARILESRHKLHAEHPDTLIETIYACDDYPYTKDNIGSGGCAVSSAAFLRAHEAHRLSWTLGQWEASPFASFISDLKTASGLNDQAFENAWRHTRFLVGGQGGELGLRNHSTTDARRLCDIAALLPRLAADQANQDRWSVADLLIRLTWRDPFGLRHGHTFPVDGLYQSNAPTQKALQQVLLAITSGYVSLIGPPGSGKSTLLAAGLLPAPRALVIRYLAFVPNEGQDLGRAEAFDFLHDLVKQLKQQDFGAQIMPGSELVELRGQLKMLLHEASRRFIEEGIRTVVVIDGLDHVPREEKPDRSFLRELPLPHALPDGVVFLLGTQRLDLEDIPPAVAHQAQEDNRCVVVTPLPREAVGRLADLVGIPDDVDRNELYARTDGHPLSTRYVFEGLLNADTAESRQEWLHNGPAYGGDVCAFYQRAWRDLERSADAKRALAYVALAEGAISTNSLDDLVGTGATDAAWNAAGHLLVRDHRYAWSIFHNSFRLFLRTQIGLRHGVNDEAAVRRWYNELADMARDAELTDPQRWMELRYRARAGNYLAVAELATPNRFRTQFIEGRDPGDIRDDIDFAFIAAGAMRQPELIVKLILSKHEINMRSDALGDDVFDALISLGELRTALGLLDAEGVSLACGKGYELVDAFLATGEKAEARKLFDSIEPIQKLLGSETIEMRIDDSDLVDWAERVLVFRDPSQFLAVLARLRPPEEHFGHGFDMEEYQTQLKIVAVRGQLGRNPDLVPEKLIEILQIGSESRSLILHLAVQAAFDADNDVLAAQHLETALASVDEFESWSRLELSNIAARIGRLDLAGAFFEGIKPPTLAGRDFAYGGEDLSHASRQIITYAAIAAWLCQPFATTMTPTSQLFATYQARLENLGRLLGEGRGGHEPSLDPLREFRITLDFLQHADGDSPYDSERNQLDKVMGEVVAIMVKAAAFLGPETFERFIEAMDARLARGAGRLGRSAVRRAYAITTFRGEFDAGRAALRLAYTPGLERTPSDQVAEAARTASAFAAFGLKEQAYAILAKMHDNGLGYSRAAKNDPQYIAWRDLFVRACDEDPVGRPDRLRFFGRLLTGMAETEGYDAGRRLALVFLNQAAQAGAAWARAAANRVEEIGLGTWCDLVHGLLTGLVKSRPDLTAAAGVIFGRVALPFSSEYDGSIYRELICAAPDDQLNSVVRHAVACLETDSHPARRIIFLEEVVEAGSERGFSHGADALARWREELPPPRSGSSPEDPFFLVRTLEEMTDVLQQVGDNVTSWGAVRAFERIAPRSDYDAAKAVFECYGMLRVDEHCINVMIQAALAVGRKANAIFYLGCLKKLAEDNGAWGSSWNSDAKWRYHRCNVQMSGEAARLIAFDSFVNDLAKRRESAGNILPNLGDVLELLSPHPTWAQTWAHFQDHLRQFREYRLGQEIELPTGLPDADEHTLADILYRAIDTTASELTHMARTAAIELIRNPGGTAVVAVLISRLWQAGGHHALQAIQITWECRDVVTIRDSVVPFLAEMCDSDDFAVRHTAMSLAREWGQRPRIKRGALPTIYKLELPPNSQANRFQPPSGTSLTSSGLFTEDPYAWTWPLKGPLTFTAKATSLDLANIRARAASLMARKGGAVVFGPDAINRQQRRLGCLNLHSTYRKLLVSAAFQAMREVIGELMAAEAIDPDGVPFILLEAAAFSNNVSTLPPAPRPVGVPRAEMANIYQSPDGTEWQMNVDQDAVKPTMEGHVVLAATAIHERRHFRDEWIVEQYFGPDTGSTENDLFGQLSCLPSFVDGIGPIYEKLASGAVVHPRPTISGSINPHMVMLCPRVAAELGWRLDPRHMFNYLDENSRLVAQTLYWRDGGELSREADTAVVRHGYIVIVKEERADDIVPYLARSQLSRAWRVTQKNGGQDRVVSCSSRVESITGL